MLAVLTPRVRPLWLIRPRATREVHGLHTLCNTGHKAATEQDIRSFFHVYVI